MTRSGDSAEEGPDEDLVDLDGEGYCVMAKPTTAFRGRQGQEMGGRTTTAVSRREMAVTTLISMSKEQASETVENAMNHAHTALGLAVAIRWKSSIIYIPMIPPYR